MLRTRLGPYQIVAVSDVYTAPTVTPSESGPTDWPRRTWIIGKYLANDIDAVIIASPDHWHLRMAIDSLAAGKDVYLEKPVTHSIEEGATLTRAVRSSKRILQCGMQQRSWTHFRDAVELIQCGSLGRVAQVRTYWWQNYQRNWSMKPIDGQALDWKLWLGSAPDQPFSDEKFNHWRWYWNFGGGALTDLFTHWIDVVHWAMKCEQPSQAFMLADKYIFDQWDCPDTIQAGFRYPGFDVVYEGMMNSSVDDGGLEFRGTEATLKIDRGGFTVYREGVQSGRKSRADGTQLPRWHHFAPGEFLRVHQDAQRAERAGRNRGRGCTGGANREPGLPSRGPGCVAREGVSSRTEIRVFARDGV